MNKQCWNTRISDSNEKLPMWRRQVLSIATEIGFPPEAAKDISLAVFEACANAVHHSGIDGTGIVTLCVRPYPDRLEATVQDGGTGMKCPASSAMPPPTSVRGRGIPLMKAVMDEVKFESENGCKTILIKYLKKEVR